VISFYSVRNIVITILLTVFSIYSFDGDREGRNAASKRNFSQEVKNLNLVFVIGLSLCLGISVLQSLNADILDKEKRPVKIYDLLARDEKERVFLNSANEGGELLYFTKGKTKVYMDGRVDRYPISVHTESAILFSQTPGWKKLALELLPCATDMLVAERLPIVGFAQTVGYKLIIKDSGFAWLSRASEASPGRNCRR
jgi:hypothetical protein